MKVSINRQQANRLASLASEYGTVTLTYQTGTGQLVVSYGQLVTRALIWSTGKLEVTDNAEGTGKQAEVKEARIAYYIDAAGHPRNLYTGEEISL